jgi:hypothetical protein
MKKGKLLGGLIMAAGAGVGIFFLARKYKDADVGAVVRTPVYHGDWNRQRMNSWQRQQGLLFTQQQGIPQVF